MWSGQDESCTAVPGQAGWLWTWLTVDLTWYLGMRCMLGVMRTGEVALRAGVNTQTLRYYERRGLLPEPPRSGSGYREYPAGTVGVLGFVKRAQRLGFTLAEIEELLDLAQGGPEACDQARALAQAHAAQLERKIADLQQMRASLCQLAATCGRPRADRSCPLLQALADTATAPAAAAQR